MFLSLPLQLQSKLSHQPHQPNQSQPLIRILLHDGLLDRYIVEAPLLAPSIELNGERYIRTETIARVQIKDRFGKHMESYRVYRKEDQ